jgi:hypothetical protein
VRSLESLAGAAMHTPAKKPMARPAPRTAEREIPFEDTGTFGKF